MFSCLVPLWFPEPKGTSGRLSLLANKSLDMFGMFLSFVKWFLRMF